MPERPVCRVWGRKRSGTNVLHATLRENLPGVHVYRGKSNGHWVHATPLHYEDAYENATLNVAIVRDPYSWLDARMRWEAQAELGGTRPSPMMAARFAERYVDGLAIYRDKCTLVRLEDLVQDPRDALENPVAGNPISFAFLDDIDDEDFTHITNRVDRGAHITDKPFDPDRLLDPARYMERLGQAEVSKASRVYHEPHNQRLLEQAGYQPVPQARPARPA